MKEKDPNTYPEDIHEEDTGAPLGGEDPAEEPAGGDAPHGDGAPAPEEAETLPDPAEEEEEASPDEGEAPFEEEGFPAEDEVGPSPGDEEDDFPPEDDEPPPPEDPAAAAKRKRKTLLINILLAVCICGMVVAIVMLITIFRRYQVASNEYEGLQSSYAPAVSEEEQGPRFIDLAALRAVNPECIGWIEIPGTKIDYPLLYSPDDNFKYLEVTFEGTWNPSGAIFVDAGNTPDFTDVNTLITGHHMKDGSMFAGLASFMKEDYLNAHKEVLIYTDEGIRHYEVLSASTVLTTDRPMSIWFGGPEDEAAFLAETGGLAPEDRVITLVTCVNSYDSSDQRYIVQAVFRSLEEMPEPASSASGSE